MSVPYKIKSWVFFFFRLNVITMNTKILLVFSLLMVCVLGGTEALFGWCCYCIFYSLFCILLVNLKYSFLLTINMIHLCKRHCISYKQTESRGSNVVNLSLISRACNKVVICTSVLLYNIQFL